jgi:hypothetical protein
MAFFTKQFETQHFNGSSAFSRIQNKHRIGQDHKVLLVLVSQPAARVRLTAHSGCIFFQHKRESQFIN